MLEVRDLVVSYDGLKALDGVSLRVDDGEFVAVVGANGAGKTTLVKAIVGLVRPDVGAVILGGRPIQGLPTHAIAGHGMAVVPEGRRLFPELTVMENLSLGAYSRRARRSAHKLLSYVFDVFPRLAERLQQPAGLLSGGEQQMLAIGRALMSAPSLLVLDEPFLGLAPKLIDEVLAVLKRLRGDGCSLLLMEQGVFKALRSSDRGYVMANGRVACEGTDLLEWPEVKTAYLGL